MKPQYDVDEIIERQARRRTDADCEAIELACLRLALGTLAVIATALAIAGS